MATKNAQKTGKEEFVFKAIKTLRTGQSKGIHVVYSGFNSAFEKHYGEPARVTVDSMIKTKKIGSRPCKGGIMIYLPDEVPVTEDRGAKALALMGIK
jgi:hypothetical protein